MIPSGQIVYQQWRWPSDSNENVDIKLSEHDAFLELLSTATLIIEILESQIFKSAWEQQNQRT
jgi:hypothetical protein